MCGIAGYLGTQELPAASVERALAVLRHRGPDDHGHAHHVTQDGRHVHLLSTRLRIIDLDPRANMPFAVASKHMVYNGELYNYLELRGELGGKDFRTTSDTEVLLRTIHALGVDGLRRCEGMWALAVYDEADGSLMLARDRFGEKPLFLYRQGTDLYFASEPKGIFALLGRRLDVDRDHLRRYLVHGYKALFKTEAEFFTGLAELPGGTVLRIDGAGRETHSRYFDRRIEPDESMSFAEAVSEARRHLVRAVELRLRADVPLAFCMSGGVDSLALISIAKRELGYDVHGFTILSGDTRYDESELVDPVVAELGLRHTVIPLSTEGFLSHLRSLIRAHDGPVATISYYAHHLLLEAIAAHGYRISVSGTAADELFSGYYDHHLLYLAEVGTQAARDAWLKHVAPLTRNPLLSDPDVFLRDPGFRKHIFLDADRYASYLVEPFTEPFAEERLDSRLLRNRMLNELFHEVVPVILREDDLNAMSVSVENRSPFLDRALYEHCGRIPTRYLVQDGYAKAVLRAAVRGIVPDPALDNRRKVGFNAPVEELLDVRDPATRAEVLSPGPLWEIVRRRPVEDLLDRGSLTNSESKFLFNVLNVKMFLEEFA